MNPALIQQQITKAGGGGGNPTPLGRWKMNEGTGFTLLDSSGNGNNLGQYGITNPALTGWSATPSFGFSAPYSIFNSGGATLYPLVTATTTEFSFTGTQPFSVSLWMYINGGGAGPEYTIVGNLEQSPNYTGWEIYLDTAGGNLLFAQYSNYTTSNGLTVQIPATLITRNVIHHLVCTYDGSRTPSGVTFYLNGVVQATTTGTNALTGSTASTSPLCLAARIDGSSTFGQDQEGILQDLQIFSSAITQAQVTAIFTAGPQ